MQGSGCPSPRLTGERGHSCIKLLIFVSSTSVSDSEETEEKPGHCGQPPSRSDRRSSLKSRFEDILGMWDSLVLSHRAAC